MIEMQFPYTLEKTNSVYQIIAEVDENAVMELASRQASILVGNKMRNIAHLILPDDGDIHFSITIANGKIRCEPEGKVRVERSERQSNRILPKVSIVPSE